MRLFTNDWSFYPRRVQIYLAEKGLKSIENEHVDMMLGEHKSDTFLELNACGTLPTLQVDDKVTIRQSMAIIFFLEESHPEPNMLGQTAIERARTQELIWLINDVYLYHMNYLAHKSPFFATFMKQSDDAAEAVYARYLMGVNQLETLSADGPFLAGHAVTIADCMMFASEQYVREMFGRGLPASCPKLNRWYDAFAGRPSANLPEYPSAMKDVAALPAEQLGRS